VLLYQLSYRFKEVRTQSLAYPDALSKAYFRQRLGKDKIIPFSVALITCDYCQESESFFINK
jgi:hypothetical protein